MLQKKFVSLCRSCKHYAKLLRNVHDHVNEYGEPATHICLKTAEFRTDKTQTCFDCSGFKLKEE